jgi:hypothetical protein
LSDIRRTTGTAREAGFTDEIAIVGTQAREARELALAAEAVGLAVRPIAFGSPLADAALAAHGPGTVRLPLAIVVGRFSLQRPALGAVLECIEVLRGTRERLPEACVVLTSTTDRVHAALGAAISSPGSGDDGSPDRLGGFLEVVDSRVVRPPQRQGSDT